MNAVQVTLTGLEPLDASLAQLEQKSARRIGRAALGVVVRELAKSIRRFIPATIARGILAPDKGIGSRVDKALPGAALRAKVGIRVGNANKNAQKFGTVNRGRRKGVGVSALNLHWFALGTQERSTRTQPPRFTGKIDKTQWGGFVQAGYTAAELPALAAGAARGQALIEKEVAKARLGG